MTIQGFNNDDNDYDNGTNIQTSGNDTKGSIPLIPKSNGGQPYGRNI
jgi:hypothetical protein